MACGISLRHKSLAELAFNTEAQARLQTRGTSLAELGLSSESLAQVHMRPSSLASIQMALGCPTGDEDDLRFIEQDAWYLHPDGEPTNSGATAGQAITQRRFMGLTGNGAFVNPTTVHVIGNMSETDPYMGPHSFLPGATMTWIGESPTQLYDGVITARTNYSSSTETRAQFTIAGANFLTDGPGGSSLIDKMARVISGANVGAVFRLEQIGPTNDTVYHNKPDIPNGIFGTTTTLEVGDRIVVEDLTQIGPVSSQANYVEHPGVLAYGAPVIEFRGIATAGASSGYSLFTPQTKFSGCNVRTHWLTLRGQCIGCRIECFTISSTEFCYLFGCSVKKLVYLFGSADLAIGSSTSFDFAGLSTGEGTWGVALYAGSKVAFYDSPSFWNWRGPALRLFEDAHIAGPKWWGTSTQSGSFGCQVARGYAAKCSAVPTLNGAAAFDFKLGNANHVWADLSGGTIEDDDAKFIVG